MTAAGSASSEARATPYELIFASERFEAGVFPAIAAEAAAAGADLGQSESFLLLESVGAAVRELHGPAEGADTLVGPSAAALAPMGALLFHAFHFARAGNQMCTVDSGLLAALLAPDLHVGAWTLAPPHPAGYVRLPRHGVWARVDPDSPAEPLDGFFWVMPGRNDPAAPAFDRLEVLLALGVRAGRPGISVIELAAQIPGVGPGHWGDVQARAEGDDFANVLPGGELRGLYSLINPAEVLKLASRIFWYAAKHPGSLHG